MLCIVMCIIGNIALYIMLRKGRHAFLYMLLLAYNESLKHLCLVFLCI